MEEKESRARALLDKTNRQFNECNALYHAAAQRCGLSDAAFWTLLLIFHGLPSSLRFSQDKTGS